MAGGMWRSSERLYVNMDRSKVVPQDSPDAAFVLVGAGCEIPMAEAERLGLVKVTPERVRDLRVASVAEEEPQTEAAEAPDVEVKAKDIDPALITTEGAPGGTAERRSPPKR